METALTQERGRFTQPVFISVATPADEAEINELRHQALYIEAAKYARFQKDPRVLRMENDPKGEVEVYIARLHDGTPVATGRYGICHTHEEVFRHLCAVYPGDPPRLPVLGAGRAAATVFNDGVIRPTPRRGAHRALRQALLQFALVARLPGGVRLQNQMGANAVGGENGREFNQLPLYLERLGYEVLRTHCGTEHCGSFIYEGPQCTNRLRRDDFAGVLRKQALELAEGRVAPWVWVGRPPFERHVPKGWVPCPETDPVALLRIRE